MDDPVVLAGSVTAVDHARFNLGLNKSAKRVRTPADLRGLRGGTLVLCHNAWLGEAGSELSWEQAAKLCDMELVTYTAGDDQAGE